MKEKKELSGKNIWDSKKKIRQDEIQRKGNTEKKITQ